MNKAPGFRSDGYESHSPDVMTLTPPGFPPLTIYQTSHLWTVTRTCGCGEMELVIVTATPLMAQSGLGVFTALDRLAAQRLISQLQSALAEFPGPKPDPVPEKR